MEQGVSASSSSRRFASDAFIPPYWASHRCTVDSAISEMTTQLVQFLARRELRVPSGKLADGLLGVCRRRFSQSWCCAAFRLSRTK
jgi:hypothetical protein